MWGRKSVNVRQGKHGCGLGTVWMWDRAVVMWGRVSVDMMWGQCGCRVSMDVRSGQYGCEVGSVWMWVRSAWMWGWSVWKRGRASMDVG